MKTIDEPCVACGADGTVAETMQHCKLPYGNTGAQFFEVVQPVMSCSACTFEWTDWRGEEARAAAITAALDIDPVRWEGMWYPIDSAPKDGSHITIRNEDGTEESGVYYAESRYCMLGAPQGSKGPGWMSTEAGHLPIDEPIEWQAAKISSDTAVTTSFFE